MKQAKHAILAELNKKTRELITIENELFEQFTADKIDKDTWLKLRAENNEKLKNILEDALNRTRIRIKLDKEYK